MSNDMVSYGASHRVCKKWLSCLPYAISFQLVPRYPIVHVTNLLQYNLPPLSANVISEG